MSAIQSASTVSTVHSTSGTGKSAKKVSRSESKAVEREGRFDRNQINAVPEPESKIDSAETARAALDAITKAAAENSGDMAGSHKANHSLLNVMVE